jgi:hypothetical protein
MKKSTIGLIIILSIGLLFLIVFFLLGGSCKAVTQCWINQNQLNNISCKSDKDCKCVGCWEINNSNTEYISAICNLETFKCVPPEANYEIFNLVCTNEKSCSNVGGEFYSGGC